MYSSRRLWQLLPVLCMLGCVYYSKYIPNPEKDIELWVATFSQQRSFSYQYVLQTGLVYTEAQGECVIGRGEYVTGIWQQANQTISFEYIGLRDREYTKNHGQWQSTTRGEQSDILVQIERLLQFDEFEYQGLNGSYQYRFKANIPFLAPGRWKEMIGVLHISKRTYLPEKIWAGLPDSSVSWSIELTKLNTKKKIRTPKVTWHGYQIAGGTEDLTRLIAKRLNAIDIEHRLAQTSERNVVTFPEYFSLEDVEGFLENHTLTVFRLVQNKEDAVKIGYLRENKNLPLYLAETLYTENNIKSIKIKFDRAYRPFLECRLDVKDFPPPEVAIDIDGLIQHVAVLDTNKKIDKLQVYTTMHYFDMQIIRASIMHVLPPVEVKPLIGEIR